MVQGVDHETQDGRERLIRRAFVLFAEKGFDSVTVRDIATASGVSVGLINHHFGSKAGLREAVDAFFIALFEDAITGAAPQPLNAPEDYAVIIDQWIARHTVRRRLRLAAKRARVRSYNVGNEIGRAHV